MVSDISKKFNNISVSWLILLVFIIVYIVQVYMISQNIDSPLEAIDFFVVHPEEPFVIYKYIVSMFAHGSPVHLIVNGIAFLSFGKVIEKLYDSKIMLFVFVVSALTASVGFVVVYNLSQITGLLQVNTINGVLGASGGISGLIGLFTVRQYKYARNEASNYIMVLFKIPLRSHVAVSIFILLSFIAVLYGGIGFANIAHTAHIIGLITGVVIGYVVVYKHNVKTIYDTKNTTSSFLNANNNRLVFMTDRKVESVSFGSGFIKVNHPIHKLEETVKLGSDGFINVEQTDNNILNKNYERFDYVSKINKLTDEQVRSIKLEECVKVRFEDDEEKVIPVRIINP